MADTVTGTVQSGGGSAAEAALAVGVVLGGIVLAGHAAPHRRAGGGRAGRNADPGPPSHADLLALAAAYEANQRSAGMERFHGNRRVFLSNRSRYVAFDTSTSGGQHDLSGLFLIDKADGSVYTIKGYGKRGYHVGTVRGLTAAYREETEHNERVRREHGGLPPSTVSRDRRAGVATVHARPSNVIPLRRR